MANILNAMRAFLLAHQKNRSRKPARTNTAPKDKDVAAIVSALASYKAAVAARSTFE